MEKDGFAPGGNSVGTIVFIVGPYNRIIFFTNLFKNYSWVEIIASLRCLCHINGTTVLIFLSSSRRL
jgi:hypothetical protein